MTTVIANETPSRNPLSADELRLIDAYWRAANYLSVGQIYLLANPLLRAPLSLDHIKRRLLGHWGTTPGLNFMYVHMNRLIRKHDIDAIFIAGPGHGGPGVVANTYLEGTYSEIYPMVSRDTAGLQRLFKQFSFPGGIPSHVAPIRISSSVVQSGMVRQKQARSRQAGIRTNSSIPHGTAPLFRSCTSTATRSPVRPFLHESATTS